MRVSLLPAHQKCEYQLILNHNALFFLEYIEALERYLRRVRVDSARSFC